MKRTIAVILVVAVGTLTCLAGIEILGQWRAVANAVAVVGEIANSEGGGVIRRIDDCVTSGPSWQNASLPAQAGEFAVDFDAIPHNTPTDGITALSAGAGANYWDFAVLVRFNDVGYLDVRDGSAYRSDVPLPYTPEASYHFRIIVNVPTHSYSVHVTPAGAAEVALATGYAFRSEQGSVTYLDNWGLVTELGTHDVCDVVIDSPRVHNVTQDTWHATIQSAIDAATGGDEIVLTPGTYTGAGNRDVDFLVKAITVRGADPDDPAVVAATVIDCQGTAADPHRAFAFRTVDPPGAVLSGLTVMNGYAPFEDLDGATISAGGALLGLASNLTVSHCVIQNNVAAEGGPCQAGGVGGAAYLAASTVVFEDCAFLADRAGDGGVGNDPNSEAGNGGHGGALFCTAESEVVLQRCEFMGNNAGIGGSTLDSYPCAGGLFGGTGGSGGAVYCNAESELKVHGCQFAENHAGPGGAFGECYTGPIAGQGGSGGAVCGELSGAMRFEACSFAENHAGAGGQLGFTTWGTGGDGGAGGAVFYAAQHQLSILDCDLYGNAAGAGGGGARYSQGYWGAGGDGGAIATRSPYVMVVGSTLVGNRSGYGAGPDDNAVYCYAGDGGSGGAMHVANAMEFQLTDSTIAGNSAGRGGGGGYDVRGGAGGHGGGVDVNSYGDIALRRCMIEGNVAGSSGNGEYNVDPGGSGGGLYAHAQEVSIADVVFCGNLTGNSPSSYAAHPPGGDGGGAYASGEVSIANALFAGNLTGRGGGCFHPSCPTGGRGGDGSGLWCDSSAPSLSNLTFSGNVCGPGGQGCYYVGPDGVGGAVYGAQSGAIAGVVAWHDDEPELAGAIMASHSCVEGGAAGTGNIDVDPLFTPVTERSWSADAAYDPLSYQTTLRDDGASWSPGVLAGLFVQPKISQPFQYVIVDNSATTITIWGNFADLAPASATYRIYDYHLMPGSPCIDAGNNAAVPTDAFDLDGDGDVDEPVPFDLDGAPRFINDPATPDCQWAPGTCGVSPVVDMGAYEYALPMCRGDCNCDGQIDFADINSFVDALLKGIYCDGSGENADVNDNGTVGFEDINPFVGMLTQNPLPINCP